MTLAGWLGAALALLIGALALFFGGKRKGTADQRIKDDAAKAAVLGSVLKESNEYTRRQEARAAQADQAKTEIDQTAAAAEAKEAPTTEDAKLLHDAIERMKS